MIIEDELKEKLFDRAVENKIKDIYEFLNKEEWFREEFKKRLPKGINKLSADEIVNIQIEVNNFIYDMVLDYIRNPLKK